MKIQRKRAARTPRDLLAAASEVFAEKGYRGATIAEICKRAGANIAAVNYHFGDKETLYREAWRHALSESLKAHPPDGGVRESAPPEERLRGQVAALLCRIADEDNREFFIAQKELTNPTGLLSEVMRETFVPLQEKMENVLRELLGPHVPDMQIRFCGISIVTQCINPMVVRRGRQGKRDDHDGPPRIDDLDAYANHVVEFSLAGIRAIREEAEKKPRGFKRQRGKGKALERE